MSKVTTFRLAVRAKSGKLIAAGRVYATLTEARAAAPVWNRVQRLAWRREASHTIEYVGRVRGAVLALDDPEPLAPLAPTAQEAAHVSAPLAALRHHVTGAIERGEAVAIIERPALDARGNAVDAAPFRGDSLADYTGV